MNFSRERQDYYWIAAFYAVLLVFGQWFYPQRTTPEQADAIYNLVNPIGFDDPLFVYVSYWVLGTVTLSGLTAIIWRLIKYYDPNICTKHFDEQMKVVTVNMILLSYTETVWIYLTINQYTKTTIHSNMTFFTVIRDLLEWIFCFELTWYTQHRLMHDNKVLWIYGHQYHHSWKRPEHMIGITNFAFDHVVEVWMTMSSSFLPVFIFPIDFYVKNCISLCYMILAVLVHWDGFPYKYHLNHHYKVVKNYGSHVPIFDILFNTYYQHQISK